jgi:hypothetical protein
MPVGQDRMRRRNGADVTQAARARGGHNHDPDGRAIAA